ncbi:putative histone-lysine n-methyltransferase protein [Phaeoacremonium minimum UCRPA7]|uniref:Histone-lysine N-methyltransferase, H3 lysine-79 specific n=1 Tax=Phaeoacremonium minimum (strain UCR-PA7) TaxID=1286976 RepID=R8BIH7_PHAM7|nr:putative histone-lysine n-methyltransferase protein [Phaeoacremonium minimum UCRPA7]EON99133.1 putative histone-lysine n-methyltransferase protein [Phaeoacremonium minimum UCRPA7]
MPLFSKKPIFKSVAVQKPRIVEEKVEAPKPPPQKLKTSLPHLSNGGGGSSRLHATSAASSPRASPKPNGHGHGHSTSNGHGHGSRLSPAVAAARFRGKSASPFPSSSDERGGVGASSRKRKVNAGALRKSPASDRVEFGEDSEPDDDDDDWEDRLDARKRRKQAARQNGAGRTDPKRELRHPVLLAAGAGESNGASKAVVDKEDGVVLKKKKGELRFIHAADVASLKHKCLPTLGASEDEVAVELQYPGSRQVERYELVEGKDKIDAVRDIIRVVKAVIDTYLTDDEALAFKNTVRQLERTSARNVWDAKGFKAALREYNDRLRALLDDGTIARNLANIHEIPANLVALILSQVYDRTVAPDVERLRKYENGTDNVYGELNAPFSSMVLADQLKMTSDQVFVDLGSGVGNVVLHAALEIGCESWGCEMMEEPCNLADRQLKEFESRCELWGIAAGKASLERGDFRKNDRILRALARADVVLVNNQAFTSQLNGDLVQMFLDLKQGCKIVSLKTFVHDFKNASYNSNDVATTILDVENHTYPEGFVSWTGVGGTYCISTRK